MTLFARQSAWLNTAPERPKGDKSTEPVPSRLQRLREDDEDYQPPMPDAQAAHLLGYLFELGPVMPGAAGAVPVTHQEIAAWQRSTGITLTPWEARVIRQMSVEYLSESHRATKADCPAPWMPADYVPDHRATAKQMRQAIAGLTKL